MSEVTHYRHDHIIYDVKNKSAVSYHGINAAKREVRRLLAGRNEDGTSRKIRVSRQKLPPGTPMKEVPSPFSYMPGQRRHARIALKTAIHMQRRREKEKGDHD